MDRVPANEYNIRFLGIDYDNLSNHEIIRAINNIEGAFYDGENNLIYTGIMDCFNDENYFNLLRELGVPTIEDLNEKLSIIKDDNIRNELFYQGFIKILDAEYNAKSKILDQLLFDKQETKEEVNIHAPIQNKEEEQNPYPRIFTSRKAYNVFINLLNEFGNKKECLSNYSYVFYKMTYEGLIHIDILHKTYIDMLSKFDISIDRIKPKSDIGKIDLRNSIYSKAK